ncbi:MAG TPA: tetratricopeptide repeat protein [Bryobacteraceae bacterium]|jgi:tetratricopeptide (TPR) repeat protein|nr:tetratricopeptide repeat protein [Bryobacteraceae bacterium]
MVSGILFLVVAGAAQLPPAPVTASGTLRADARQDQLAVPQQPRPHQILTPENRGDIYMARKMYREAVDKYQEIKPQTAVIANKIGIAYHQMLDLKTARKFYERSLKLDSHYAEAMNNLGTVYYGQKKFRPAIRQYKKALKIEPDSASIYSNLGTAYFARHKFKEAVKAYQQAMSLDPEVFEHRNSFGVMLQERAVDDLAVYHYYMAKVYASSGVQDRALLYMRKALEEGFKDRARFRDDPAFAKMQKLAEFQQLLALQPRIL